MRTADDEKAGIEYVQGYTVKDDPLNTVYPTIESARRAAAWLQIESAWASVQKNFKSTPDFKTLVTFFSENSDAIREVVNEKQ